MTYHAGFTSFRCSDPDGSLACGLWYPTDTAARRQNQGVYEFNVAKTADISTGKFPLIVMSHGSGGTRFGHCKTAEFFAQNGFIVLAPEHPFNNFFDDSGAGSARIYQNRSRHIQSALNGLLLDPKWAPVVDENKISIFGFSLGGFTALTCVGALPHVEGLRRHNRMNREFDPIFTGYEVIIRDGYDQAYLPVTKDARFKACIALAPVGGGLFPKDSLKDITVPVQIFRAERDMILRQPFHSEDIRQNLPRGCDYHVTPKAGHYSYLSPVRDEMKGQLGELAHDDAGFDREKEHTTMHHHMLAFLKDSLSL